MKTKIITTLLAAGLAGSASAAVVFTDDFETPDVVSTYAISNTSQTVSSDWVRAAEGYGAGSNGLVDEAEDSGNNFVDTTTGTDAQALGFRSTNSGVTSAAGILGTVTADQTITLSFSVAYDAQSNGLGQWTAEILGWDTADATGRNDARNTNTALLLANLSGTLDEPVSGAATFFEQSFSFTVGDAQVEAGDALGKDWTVRFTRGGGGGMAMVDDVSVDLTPIPEPGTFALLAGMFGLTWVMLRRRD
jgi:hypothetical protein